MKDLMKKLSLQAIESTNNSYSTTHSKMNDFCTCPPSFSAEILQKRGLQQLQMQKKQKGAERIFGYEVNNDNVDKTMSRLK
jgi:hypothetical protein